MYLAVELGNVDLNPVFKGALATTCTSWSAQPF